MALINKELNCCFIHIPKTAGTSIRWLFRDSGFPLDIVGDEHDPMMPEFKDYYSFAVVRNPFDWIISYKLYISQWPPHRDHVRANTLSLIDWIKYQDTLPHQADYINGVQDLFRYDQLSKYIHILKQKFNLDATLPDVNKSKRKPYIDYYDVESRELAFNLFRKDYDIYNNIL